MAPDTEFATTKTDFNYHQVFRFGPEIDPDSKTAICVHVRHPSDDWEPDVIHEVSVGQYTLRFRSLDRAKHTYSTDDRPVTVELENGLITLAAFELDDDQFRSLGYALEEAV